MAELVVMLRDNLRVGHPSPNMAYRPGDIVTILEDGVAEGCVETGPPIFTIVRIPGATVADIKALRYTHAYMADDLDPNAVVIKRRLFTVDENRFIPAVRTKMRAGRITIGNRKRVGARPADDATVDTMLAAIVHKRSGVTEYQRGRREIDIKRAQAV